MLSESTLNAFVCTSIVSQSTVTAFVCTMISLVLYRDDVSVHGDGVTEYLYPIAVF